MGTHHAAGIFCRELGEQLDAHRKRQQLLHPDLTMTGMYNVLEKLREIETTSRDQRAGSVSARSSADVLTRAAPGADASGSKELVLTAKERKIHEGGLVSVLKRIHDDLDAAVFEAYGWPGTLSDEEILERLVALNHERASEESAGKIRWIRPEFQCPTTGPTTKTQQSFAEEEEEEEEESDKGQGARGRRRPPRKLPPRNPKPPPRPIGQPPSPNASAPSAKP